MSIETRLTIEGKKCIFATLNAIRLAFGPVVQWIE